MERKTTEAFEKWKNDPDKVGLLVEGPRQVGKTYIIREFGKTYRNFLEINLHDDTELRSLFSNDITAKTVIEKIGIRFPDFRIVKGESLLFIDEIQDCPSAISAIKPLVDDGRLDVIASGSMLGLQFKGPHSYPVGYVSSIRMYPMTFEEYLMAKGLGAESIVSIRENISKKKPFDAFTLDTLNDYFREYMQVGGMPLAVSTSLDRTKQMSDVFGVQENILTAYRRDIISYAPADCVNDVSHLFDKIPAQLSRQSKRFRYRDISGNVPGRYESFKEPIDWVSNSKFVDVCISLRSIEHPLKSQCNHSKFKAYLSDTGLLMQMYGTDTRLAIMDKNMAVNEGAVTENMVLQMLSSSGRLVFYFDKNTASDEGDGENTIVEGEIDIDESVGKPLSKEKNLRMEIDFITSFGADLVAIEVKSGKSRKAKSLMALKDTVYGKNVKRFIRLTYSNISVDEFGIEHYPLFCAAFTDAMFVERKIEKI